MSADGSITASYGDIEINNVDGTYDIWLDDTTYIWTNRTIEVYHGDPDWVLADWAAVTSNFKLVFAGVVSDIDSKSRNVINLKIRDKMERLNAPLTDVTFTDGLGSGYGTWDGGNSGSQDILPLIFGEVFNVEPTMIDPATLEYMVNNGNTEEIIEIRDNGVPIWTVGDSVGTVTSGLASLTLATGRFKLKNSIFGVCTVSVKGLKSTINLTTGALLASTYSDTIAKTIAFITTQYGKSSTRLVADDLDLVNLGAFNDVNFQPIGVIVKDRDNVLSVCQAIASSIGAQLFFTREGKLQLLRIGIPTADANVPITASDIVLDSLDIVNRTPAVAAQKLGYAKNWTVQKGLTSGITKEQKNNLKREWYYEKAIASTVKDNYKLHEAPVVKETLLIVKLDAIDEVARLKDYYKKPLTTYKFTCISTMLSLKLGQAVTLYNSRFNLSAGKVGQVTSLSPNWSTGLIAVEVTI